MDEVVRRAKISALTKFLQLYRLHGHKGIDLAEKELKRLQGQEHHWTSK